MRKIIIAKVHTKVHSLGKAQSAMMDELLKRGLWFPGCGWSWNGASNTERIMESLLKRGLVTKTTKRATKLLPERCCYHIAKQVRDQHV